VAQLLVKDDSGYGWTEITVDHAADEIIHQQKEDVTALLDQNARERSESPIYLGEGDNTSAMKVGSISPLMMMNLIEAGIFWDDKKLLAWFDDLDNYLWRTTDKKRKERK